MGTLELEIGRQYLNRIGEVITLVDRHTDDKGSLFRCERHRVYDENGAWSKWHPCYQDLVAPYEP